MTLREMLQKIGGEFSAAKNNKFKGNSLAEYIRKQAPSIVLRALETDAKGLVTDGSPGKGRWADVPWVTVFYPVVTTSATKGYYVVYLFNYETQMVYLSLNQGATAVHEEFGKTKGNQVLRERAALITARVPDYAEQFSTAPIKLGSGTLPRGYEAGHAFGCEYHLDALPSEKTLNDDLKRLCRAYLALQFRGGLEPSLGEDPDDEITEKNESKTLQEKRKYRTHKRIERNPKAAKLAKKGKPPICQACGFEFSKFYGSLGHGYIEAHHLLPLGHLSEGQAIEYNAEEDFALLCSNCHRMIHRQDDPSDIDALKHRISIHRRKAF